MLLEPSAIVGLGPQKQVVTLNFCRAQPFWTSGPLPQNHVFFDIPQTSKMSTQGTPRELEIEPKSMKMSPKRRPETATQKNIEIYPLHGTLGHQKTFKLAILSSKIKIPPISQTAPKCIPKSSIFVPLRTPFGILLDAWSYTKNHSIKSCLFPTNMLQNSLLNRAQNNQKSPPAPP